MRRLTLNEEIGPGGPLEMLLNNSKLEKLGIPGSITERPQVGATEIWEIINLTADMHPIHPHLAEVQVLSRQRIQAAQYTRAYNASFPGGPGYVWHCHIIDHEDNEMMRRYEVAP